MLTRCRVDQQTSDAGETSDAVDRIVAGPPFSDETGGGFPRSRQARVAAGFVLTSVRYRLQYAADLWWRLADKVLVSRAWSNTFVWLPILFAVALVVNQDGIYGVIANYENLASLTGSLFVTIHLGRRWRGVKPPKNKPRAREE
jgi:hypothetical protein